MLWLIMAAIVGIGLFFAYHLIRYRNPYKLIMVFGKKGSGKSTLMTKLSLRYARQGRTVYCNTPVCGTWLFNTDDVGKIHFPENSVIMIDEVGMVWDNRNFKNFKTEVRDYFKLQRHYKNTVYLFSQSFDVDKKLRDLTDNMYLITNFMNCFSFARLITKKITISHGDQNQSGDSHLIDDLRFSPLITLPFGGLKVTYLPKYAKYFDSFECPKLNEGEFKYIPFPEEKEQLLLEEDNIDEGGANNA